MKFGYHLRAVYSGIIRYLAECALHFNFHWKWHRKKGTKIHWEYNARGANAHNLFDSIFLEPLQQMHSRTCQRIVKKNCDTKVAAESKWVRTNVHQIVFTSNDTVNRKIKIIDDTIVISNIFVDNIVFYVHGSLTCATFRTELFEWRKITFVHYFFHSSHCFQNLTYFFRICISCPPKWNKTLWHYGIFGSHFFLL